MATGEAELGVMTDEGAAAARMEMEIKGGARRGEGRGCDGHPQEGRARRRS
jgi:hypothetical protein